MTHEQLSIAAWIYGYSLHEATIVAAEIQEQTINVR